MKESRSNIEMNFGDYRANPSIIQIGQLGTIYVESVDEK